MGMGSITVSFRVGVRLKITMIKWRVPNNFKIHLVRLRLNTLKNWILCFQTRVKGHKLACLASLQMIWSKTEALWWFVALIGTPSLTSRWAVWMRLSSCSALSTNTRAATTEQGPRNANLGRNTSWPKAGYHPSRSAPSTANQRWVVSPRARTLFEVASRKQLWALTSRVSAQLTAKSKTSRKFRFTSF